MDKLELILSKIEGVDQKLENMNQKFEEKFESVDERFDSIDKRFEKIDEKLDSMDTDITSIKLMIENEIRPNIQRVAEGHLDLSRNLQKAIKSNNEFEMLAIRVSMLETDVREVKRKIS